jgi:hypothetical protein
MPKGDDMTVVIQLAIRDREVKNRRYDKDGNRVYEKFEMDEEEEEEDEEDGVTSFKWGEVVEPKLVRAATGQGFKGEGTLEEGAAEVGADGD